MAVAVASALWPARATITTVPWHARKQAARIAAPILDMARGHDAGRVRPKEGRTARTAGTAGAGMAAQTGKRELPKTQRNKEREGQKK